MVEDMTVQGAQEGNGNSVGLELANGKGCNDQLGREGRKDCEWQR